jgi:hypothetical protein
MQMIIHARSIPDLQAQLNMQCVLMTHGRGESRGDFWWIFAENSALLNLVDTGLALTLVFLI